MYSEKAESDYVGTPFCPGAAGTAAGSDAAAVKHDGHVIGCFRLTRLTGHYSSAEMEAWRQTETHFCFICAANISEHPTLQIKQLKIFYYWHC